MRLSATPSIAVMLLRLMVWLVLGRDDSRHKQVAHHRCSSGPCADHSLIFAAGLDS